MDRLLLDAARKIERASDLDRLWAVFAEAVSQFGIEHAIYLSASDTPPQNAFVRSTLQDNWPEAEFADPDFVEPFLAHCCATFELTNVGPEFLPEHEYMTEGFKAYVRNVRAHGLHSGLGIPCRLRGTGRHGGFLLCNAQTRFEFERLVLPQGEALRGFCLIAHRRIEDLRGQREADEKLRPLSARERETLHLIAQGQRPKQIAHQLGVSESSVRLYLKNARAKLRAETKEEAVLKMLRLSGAEAL